MRDSARPGHPAGAGPQSRLSPRAGTARDVRAGALLRAQNGLIRQSRVAKRCSYLVPPLDPTNRKGLADVGSTKAGLKFQQPADGVARLLGASRAHGVDNEGAQRVTVGINLNRLYRRLTPLLIAFERKKRVRG